MADYNSIGSRGAWRPCPLLSTSTKRPSSPDILIIQSPLFGSYTSASSSCLPSLSATFTTCTTTSRPNTSQQITIASSDSLRGFAVAFGLVVVVVVTLSNSSSSTSSLLVLVVVLGTRTAFVVVVDLVVVVAILVGVWTGSIISIISLIDIFRKKTTTPLFLDFCTYAQQGIQIGRRRKWEVVVLLDRKKTNAPRKKNQKQMEGIILIADQTHPIPVCMSIKKQRQQTLQQKVEEKVPLQNSLLFRRPRL